MKKIIVLCIVFLFAFTSIVFGANQPDHYIGYLEEQLDDDVETIAIVKINYDNLDDCFNITVLSEGLDPDYDNRLCIDGVYKDLNFVYDFTYKKIWMYGTNEFETEYLKTMFDEGEVQVYILCLGDGSYSIPCMGHLELVEPSKNNR